MKLIFSIFLSLFITNMAIAEVKVTIVTNLGDIQLKLDDKNAPVTVANFVNYAESGFYDGTIFHRVIRNFMIQGGGFNAKMEKIDTLAPIKNEASKDLKNLRGTIAMARTNDPHSATSQFFINHKNNANLDPGANGWGYAVFGKIINGMDIVDKIAAVTTDNFSVYQNVPVQPIIIEQVIVE